MIVLKLYYHLICLVKTLFYRLIYGKSFTISFSSTYRTGFHVVIEHSGGKNRQALFLQPLLHIGLTSGYYHR